MANSALKVQFLGAARQVTGSCYLLYTEGFRLLIDCGMYQERKLLARNWESFPVPPESIDVLLLTHAHLDHCGLIPKLVKEGFRGRIVSTAASRDLAHIVLHDSARIQEEDAAFKKRRHEREGRKGPYPVVPLYTPQDVREAMPRFDTVGYGETVELSDDLTASFHDAGHILGSAMIELRTSVNGEDRTLVFSGDIGQPGRPLVRDAVRFREADYLVMESTYGNRRHEDAGDVEEQLAAVINDTVERGGNVVIPTFAVERAQELMYTLGRLVRADRIPHLMAFLDSPMAVEVTEVFRRHRHELNEEVQDVVESGGRLFRFPRMHLVESVEESKAINRIRGSCIILAGSGMCTAGRIKHHLVNNITRAESTIVFVGYQAQGTLGRRIVNGDRVVRILGADYPVVAKVAQIHGLSGHADQRGLLTWLKDLVRPPRRVFLTHGEATAAEELASRLRARRDWHVEVPAYRQEFDLD